MPAQSLPEDIEYRQRLKWGSVFQYTTKQHSRADVLTPNYFHNISQRYLDMGDEIHVCIQHLDGSWSKGLFEVILIDHKNTEIEQLGSWRSSGGERADKKRPASTKAA